MIEVNGIDAYDLKSGDRYLKLHHYADPAKDSEWLKDVERSMSGTPHQFRQQILMIDSQAEGALWKREWFDYDGFRLPSAFVMMSDGSKKFRPPEGIIKIVVAIDPSVSDPERSKRPDKELDECGLGVAGVDADGNGYVLGDFTKIMSPEQWGSAAIQLHDFTHANSIIAEKNQGGELVRFTLQTFSKSPVIELVHAAIGKRPRAEPLAALYYQGRVKHCGDLHKLENEMVTWDGSNPKIKSPNRIDWTVWAFHALGLCDATEARQVNRMVQRDEY